MLHAKPNGVARGPGSGSKFIEHTLALDKIKLDVQEALDNISGPEPPHHDSSPVNCNDTEFERLITELESDSEAEGSIKEHDGGLRVPKIVPDDLLHTEPMTGLSEAHANERRNKYGVNELSERRNSHMKQFVMFFVGPIQFVMEGALILAAICQDWVDLGVIASLLLLNAVVGFAQECSAGSIVKELRKNIALKSVVLRAGEQREVLSTELVPGDIVKLEEGAIVPADGTLVTSNSHLQVDQSAITGESLVVDLNEGDHVFQSSTVKRGEAYMIVSAIGDSTKVGRLAALVNAGCKRKGHLKIIMDGIAAILLSLVILTLIIVWISGFYRSSRIFIILAHTLAITIIGVPVGLPAVVTTTMAVGAAYLGKRKAIVQKFSAIESLAGVEILCTDKTGTLTKNKLSLKEPYTTQGVTPDELMLVACLAASRKRRGLDAIDTAFLKALKNYPNTKDMLKTFRVESFTPFDCVSKIVTAVVESPKGEKIICVKGAPPSVYKMVREASGVPGPIEEGYNEKVAEFARRGFRSLGVARKRAESPWELLGIMPCSDPPREDTAKTINEAKSLGLKIKMLTGDGAGIAKETSRQLGLGENIYNSERLGLTGGGDFPGSKIYDYVEAADGFAEVFPEHKYNVVDVLQKRGHLVAMTGDGVNDAPSLKRADTGIAVEGSTDAARSAADIIFLAPGLSAIIDALKVSRQIFHRMYAYIVYRIALTIHLELFLGLWIAIANDGLKIELIVFVAIFADIATLAIAYDNAPYSPKPVKWNLPVLWGTAIPLGIVLAAGTWICLTTIGADGQSGIIEGKGLRDSILFLEIVLTENWLILITRTGGRPFWSSQPAWQLIAAVFLVDVLATIFCLFGWFDGGLASVVTSPLTVLRVWIFSLGVFFIMAGLYYVLADSSVYDRLLHLKSPFERSRERRNVEDLVYALQRTSSLHDRDFLGR